MCLCVAKCNSYNVTANQNQFQHDFGLFPLYSYTCIITWFYLSVHACVITNSGIVLYSECQDIVSVGSSVITIQLDAF